MQAKATDDKQNNKPPYWVIAVLVLFGVGVVWLFASGLDLMPYNDQNDTEEVEYTEDQERAKYIGLEENEALEKAEGDGVPARVIRRDGEDLPVTMDFMPDRLNFTIEEGVVRDVVRDEDMGGY